MAISGNLRTMPFPDLMQWISLSRKTGTLVITGEHFTKKILFRDGLVSAVASNNPREQLGYLLVGWGYITEEDLLGLLDQQHEKRVMLGELIVLLGLMSRDDMARLVLYKTEYSVYDLMVWEEGEFFFVEDAQPRRAFHELALSVDHFILEGARQADERKRMRELIPDVLHRPRLRQRLNESALNESAQAIVRAIDGERSIEDLALHCRLPEFDVLSFVHQGAAAGAFEILPPSPTPRPVPGAHSAGWRDMMRDAETSLSLGDLLEAYRLLKALREKYASSPAAIDSATSLEREIEREFQKDPLSPNLILELAVPINRITEIKAGPDEAFVISRINGTYTVTQVLNLLPGDALYNMLILRSLIQRGVVKTRESQAVARYKAFRS